MVILERLSMFVTSDPVAELDFALAELAEKLQAARATGDVLTQHVLSSQLDRLLDVRCAFTNIR